MATTHHDPLTRPETSLTRRYLRVLEQWVPVGVGAFSDWPVRPNCGHFFGGCHWYGQETLWSMLGLIAAYSSPEYDAGRGGVSKSELGAVCLKALRYLCFTHDSGPADCVRPAKGLGRSENEGTKWGERGIGFFRESQCGSTIAGMAIVARVLGGLVDPETARMLETVHRDYAARFGRLPPQNGVYLDTQMEENAWTSLGLASVECVLGDDPEGVQAGLNTRRWMLSTAATPQDAKDRGTFADGKTVSELVGKTFTTLPDYMAENHGVVHPSYTATAPGFAAELAVLYGLHGRELPPHALFNRERVYAELKRTADRAGYSHPAQGMDWPYHGADPGTWVHAAASVLLGDGEGAAMEMRALRTLELRQAGNGGRMIGREIAESVRDIQDPMVVREPNMIGRAAYSYFLHRLRGDGERPVTEPALERSLRGIRLYPHSGFLFHRHPHGQTSVSWRNCVMVLPLTSDGVETVAPASGSVLATFSVKDRPDSQHLEFVHHDRHPDRYALAFALQRAQGSLDQLVLAAGLPDGRTLSWERLVAREATTVEQADQGFLRITNECWPAYRGNNAGHRTVSTPDTRETFASGVSPDPDSDVVRTWDHPQWINIDGRMGVVFAGTGRTTYRNRHYYERWWAVADDLVLSHQEGSRSVSAGALVGELCALFLPDASAARTRSAAREGLRRLRAPAGTLAVVVDGWLAAARFEGATSTVAVTERRVPAEAVSFFPGVTTVTDKVVRRTLALPPKTSRLERAVAVAEVSGSVTVVAAPTGQATVRNTGRARAVVKPAGGRATTLKPGAWMDLA